MPVMAPRTTAASVTLRVIGPAVSCWAEMGTMASRLASPSVGLRPTTPLAPDGQTIEPSVSVPMATVARSEAAPTAEPELDPQGLRSRTYGLRVWPPTALHPLEDWLPRKFAHSERFALPMISAPAALRRLTMKASGGVLPASARDPAVVGIPVVSMLS